MDKFTFFWIIYLPIVIGILGFMLWLRAKENPSPKPVEYEDNFYWNFQYFDMH